MHYTLSFDTSAICCSGIKLLDLLRDQSGVVECYRLSFFGSDFFAIRATTRSTTSGWIAQALYLSWAFLAIVIVNDSLDLLPLSPMIKYIPAGLLVTLHLYNLNYCRCEDDVCSSE